MNLPQKTSELAQAAILNAVGKRTSDDELAHYTNVASSNDAHRSELLQRLRRFTGLGGRIGQPTVDVWLDSVFDCLAQRDVLEYLSNHAWQGRVLQVGGSGTAALRFLIGGAAHATLVTPAVGELDLATRLAADLGVADRFEAKQGFGEEIPMDSESASAVISEACLHHTDVSLALQEARRVLSPGGRFGAWDPWRAMLYGVGIAVFGKRDPDVDCRPLDPIRIAEFEAIFPGGQVIHHGTLSRYPAIAANKLGLRIGIRSMSRLMDWDDRVTKKFERLRRNGSSVALLGEKS